MMKNAPAIAIQQVYTRLVKWRLFFTGFIIAFILSNMIPISFAGRVTHGPLANEIKSGGHFDGTFPNKIDLLGEKVLIVDPSLLSWAAYNEQGQLVGNGRSSLGQNYCADVKRGCKTPHGIFRIERKGNAYCRSSKFPVGKGGAPMPYCMFFNGGYAVHGSPDVPNWNASHGCVRVLPAAAAWLNAKFIESGTLVIIRPYR